MLLKTGFRPAVEMAAQHGASLVGDRAVEVGRAAPSGRSQTRPWPPMNSTRLSMRDAA